MHFSGVSDRFCVCEWCDPYFISVEEREYFWEQIKKELCSFCGLRGSGCHYHQNGYNLYNMKTYFWSTGGEMLVFKIGLNPMRSFQVEVILERENHTEYVYLDKNSVNELFSVIHKLYQLDAYHPDLYADSGLNAGCVHISVHSNDSYTLSIKNRSMSLNDKNLLGLVDMQPWIIEILQIYELGRIEAESSLFRLLEVFNTRNIALRSSELIQLISASCSYVANGFIIEMGTQHYNLLSNLFAVYQVTRAMFKSTHPRSTALRDL